MCRIEFALDPDLPTSLNNALTLATVQTGHKNQFFDLQQLLDILVYVELCQLNGPEQISKMQF